MTHPKTLLVGLDAACWPYLNPLLEAGELPTIAAMRSKGAWGTLQSTMPPLTPVAWSTIITGKNPGKHGVFDMVRRIDGAYELAPVHANVRHGDPFWRQLNDAGIRVGLVNVPFTYPPDEMDGFIVSGFGAPSSAENLIWPASAREVLGDKGISYQPNVSTATLRSGNHQQILEAERRLQSNQVDIAIQLARQLDIQVLVINLMILDHLNHKLPTMEGIRQALRFLDEDLGKLLDSYSPDIVLAISDHGSRRVRGDFLLHTWLNDKNYAHLKARSPKEQGDALNWVLLQWLGEKFGAQGIKEKVLRGIFRRMIPNMPASIQDEIWHRIELHVPLAREKTHLSEELDYQRTQVFPGGSYSGVLYLNQIGRERHGVVATDQREALIDQLRRELLKIRDPEKGTPVFDNVHSSHELYQGPFNSIAPDLILDGYSSSWNILSTYYRGPWALASSGRYFVENSTDFGHHSREGIFVFSGESFADGRVAEMASVEDVPASLLHLYGIPLPEDYDGQVINQAFKPSFMRDHPVQSSQTVNASEYRESESGYSPEEEREIEEHLRSLGYLD